MTALYRPVRQPGCAAGPFGCARWVVVDRSGFETLCAGRAEWLAEWWHRVRAIEAADRPIQRRREGLERMLAANANAFRALVEHGALDAVLEATGAAAAADGRLSLIDVAMGAAA